MGLLEGGRSDPTSSRHLASHTSNHTNTAMEVLLGSAERAVAEEFLMLLTHLHLVWGRVVPDIPDFCRELVAALAEE